MKHPLFNITTTLFWLLYSLPGFTQSNTNTDSLKKRLAVQGEDTNKVRTLYTLSFAYVAGSYPDTGLVYAQDALRLAERLHDEPGQFWSLITLGEALAILGNYPPALECDFKALTLANKSKDTLKRCYGNGSLAGCYYYMEDYPSSLNYAREVLKIISKEDIYWMWIQLSKSFHGMRETDSALLYAGKAWHMIRPLEFPYAESIACTLLGNAYAAKGQPDSALFYYRRGIPLSLQSRTQTHLVDNYYGIADVYRSIALPDSALLYAKKILTEKITRSYPAGLLRTTTLLANLYESQHQADSALKYYKLAAVIQDSMNNRKKTIAVQHLIYREQRKQEQLEALTLQYRNRLKWYGLSGLLALALVVTVVAVRRYRQKQLQTIRDGIAADLHDDIGATLSSISIMSELAKSKSPEAVTLLASIGESTQSAQENMSDIVWAIQSGNHGAENLLQRMQQFAGDILDAKNIQLDFFADAALYKMGLSMKQRKNCYFFFKEAVNNAAKHSAASHVIVRVLKKNSYVQLSIRDDGRGFDAHQTHNGNGMSSFHKRAEELNGLCTIRSGPTEGTLVELAFKIT